MRALHRSELLGQAAVGNSADKKRIDDPLPRTATRDEVKAAWELAHLRKTLMESLRAIYKKQRDSGKMWG